jgi:uncharacterized protein YjbI with pentapeptide repeats
MLVVFLLVGFACSGNTAPIHGASKPTPTDTRPAATSNPALHQCAREPGPDYRGAELIGKKFVDQDLVCARFAGTKLERVSFTTSQLALADFGEAELTEVDFSSSDLAGASFEAARLHDVEFEDANLRAANFLHTSLVSVEFSNTTCPDGENSNDVGGTCAGGHM